jgi:thiol:disulfide interchange protein DsbC
MRKHLIGLVAVIFGFSSMFLPVAYAESASEAIEQVSDTGAVPEEISKRIVAKLKASRPDMNFSRVERTPIKGLYLVRIDGTQFLYASETGEYILSGDMYRARPGLFVPVKDLAAAKIRKNLIGAVDREDTIVFPAVDETKSVLYVFTDVDCYYCQKLHNEAVADLNENGVEVRYLAYPRAGLDSESYRKIASAWCAEDKQKAMTALKQLKPIRENVCESNPVASQYSLGQEVGVTGTPALILEDGTLMPGYRPAPELLRMLGVN